MSQCHSHVKVIMLFALVDFLKCSDTCGVDLVNGPLELRLSAGRPGKKSESATHA